MDPKHLLREIEGLSSLRRMEVEDFIRFLASKEQKHEQIPPMNFSWAGGLADLKTKYTSHELKKQALDWISGYGS